MKEHPASQRAPATNRHTTRHISGRVQPKPGWFTRPTAVVGFVSLLSIGLPVTVAKADPIVKQGAQPGVAASWSANGKTATTLVIASGYNAADVAKAISQAIPTATAKAKADKVLVSGLSTDDLLKKLQTIDVDPALDDIDTMLSALQFANADDGSGSSIRATKSADFTDVMGEQNEQISAKVVSVKRDRFPLVFVTVKIESMPKGNAPAGIKRGQRITVLPRVKSKKGLIDPEDKASKLNVGAWYAQPGDRVKIRLEEQHEKIWIAAGFDRSTR
ncbi:MAG: hypothetical protein IPK13_25445 [Deltaproteobacteria bacterium]|nr:hypothetical protein [Deltaproteobacteria bacterium]